MAYQSDPLGMDALYEILNGIRRSKSEVVGWDGGWVGKQEGWFAELSVRGEFGLLAKSGETHSPPSFLSDSLGRRL